MISLEFMIRLVGLLTASFFAGGGADDNRRNSSISWPRDGPNPDKVHRQAMLKTAEGPLVMEPVLVTMETIFSS